ncbi:hypothetical protein [Streptomyces sp. NPDC007856]|uniref:hypothetical protein n=1 Tax=Streptomyces sp. NPDC007856 TaxID=3364781 RepID=UPI0036C3080D
MSEQPWTIERICDALGNPVLAQKFLGEINRAPEGELLQTFAEWVERAERVVAAVERGREIAAAEARGEEPPGQWVDVTERVLGDAARIRSQGAA